MHAVGTCSTGILAILFPTTDRILTRTLPEHQSYDIEDLYPCIHMYTAC